MNRYLAVLSFACVMLVCAGLPGRGGECETKCAEELAQCKNRCRVMAADNTGCEERCAGQKERCAAACAGVSNDRLDAGPEDELQEDLPGGDTIDDLEELEGLEYHFDGVDGMPENGWGDLDDWNGWSTGD